jgi:hypothetical protein
MTRTSRLTPALLMLALLSASPALPQARRGAAAPRPTSLVEVLRGLLPDFLTRLWGEEGCGGDPYGTTCRPAAASPAKPTSLTTVRAEEGCGVDPYGVCGNQTPHQLPSGH